MENKENRQKREIKVISQAGKATSQKWGDSYNVQNLDNGQTSPSEFQINTRRKKGIAW